MVSVFVPNQNVSNMSHPVWLKLCVQANGQETAHFNIIHIIKTDSYVLAN